MRKVQADVQGFLLPASGSVRKRSSKAKAEVGPHFDEAFRLTLSLTCSMVFGFASLLPPLKPTERPTVPRRVPRARYSVLIARPRITLHSDRPVNKRSRIGEEAGDKLGHDGTC